MIPIIGSLAMWIFSGAMFWATVSLAGAAPGRKSDFGGSGPGLADLDQQRQ